VCFVRIIMAGVEEFCIWGWRGILFNDALGHSYLASGHTQGKPGSLTCPVLSTDNTGWFFLRRTRTYLIFVTEVGVRGVETRNPWVGSQVFYHKAKSLGFLYSFFPSIFLPAPFCHGCVRLGSVNLVSFVHLSNIYPV